eukprot:gene8220-45_t
MKKCFIPKRKFFNVEMKLYNTNKIIIYKQKLQNCLKVNDKLMDYTEVLVEMDKEKIIPDDETIEILRKIADRVQKEQTRIKKKSETITKRLPEETIREFMKNKKLI